jgi:hypothetical protein
MILTDRRFLLADRKFAIMGLEGRPDLADFHHLLSQNIETAVKAEGVITIRLADLQRMLMMEKQDGSARIILDFVDIWGKKETLGIFISGSRDNEKRELSATGRPVALENILRQALPPSVLDNSQWVKDLYDKEAIAYSKRMLDSPDIPPKHHLREFLEFQRRFTLEMFLTLARNLVIHPDYTPESLDRLDRHGAETPAPWKDVVESWKERGLGSPATLWLLHMMPGVYFGEVLVKNLGGRWQPPNRVLAILGFLRPGVLYRHWYVIVGRRKVPVFELARRWDVTGRTESLSRAYQWIAREVMSSSIE